jgi:hypothetical protein
LALDAKVLNVGLATSLSFEQEIVHTRVARNFAGATNQNVVVSLAEMPQLHVTFRRKRKLVGDLILDQVVVVVMLDRLERGARNENARDQSEGHSKHSPREAN